VLEVIKRLESPALFGQPDGWDFVEEFVHGLSAG